MAIVNCNECGKQLSSLAAACPSCGAPVSSDPVVVPVGKPQKKKLGLLKIVGIVFGSLFLLGMCGKIMGGKESESAASGVSAEALSLPWISATSSNCQAYKSAPNDIKKSLVFNSNEELLKGVSIAQARGTLKSMSTNQGGEELRLSINVGDAKFSTESLFAPIKKGSAVYLAASEMTEGQCVIFSASKIEASSVMEQSKVCDPEYFAMFTELSPCN